MSDLKGQIPQSNALSEATPESLSELFATNPEQLDPRTEAGAVRLKRMVEALRKMYGAWALSEQQAKLPKAKAKPPAAKLSAPVSSEGLDF